MRARWLQLREWFARRQLSMAVSLAYALSVALFLWVFAQFHIPGKGFSYLIAFGSHFEDSRLSKLRRVDYYVERASDGYDAQYYVQIAMDPSLQNTQLRNAVDSLPYRARRILLPAIAHVTGLGEPGRILQAYALQNTVAWLLLAALLLHWFPPGRWDNFLRWAGVLGTFGLCLSVRHALTDGPSLLLITGGVLLLERGRPWAATAVLGLSGLAKETNLLGAAALAPAEWRPGAAWGPALLRGLLVAAPLALWLGFIALKVGPASDTGYRNFDWPFAAYRHKWAETVAALPDASWAAPGAVLSVLSLLALTAQMLFLLLRPRWSEAWWRIGASFAVLMIVLGDAVWEGYPGAASRVLLPMQLAFNCLVPAGGRWRALLIAGNLSLLAAPFALQPPPGEGFRLTGASELLGGPAGRAVRIELGDAWHPPEGSARNMWLWTKGPAEIALRNPHAQPVDFRLRFGLGSTGARSVRVKLNGVVVWQTTVTGRDRLTAALSNLVLQPGDNRLVFETDEPARRVGHDPRDLAFAVHNLRFDLLRFAGD